MARVELPLIGPAYKNRELPLSAQVTRNMWPEINPEARNVVALHNAAGIRVFSNLGGADRGSHDFNNLMYQVMGQTLWSVDADGINIELGTIEGANRTVMADDGQQLIIVTGDKPYRYTVEGGVEEITDPDLVKPTSVAYINQQFIFDQNDGIFGEFVTTSGLGLSVDALDFAQAESHPDDIIRVLAFRQLIYFYGSHSVEPWSNIGRGNPPFSRVDSGIQLYGLAGIHGVLATSKFMYFLDNRRIPRRSSGLDFINIGNSAIGVEFAKYSKIDDVILFEFVQDNQQFVAYTFPTANRTWVFHEPSGSWFQLAHGIGEDRHRASSMLNIYGLNYCADHSNGLIYEYSLDIYSDDGEAIIKQRDTAVIHGGLFDAPGKKIEYNMVEFIIVSGETEVAGTGLGPQPSFPASGLCGTSEDLTQGQLLSSSGITNPLAAVEQINPLAAGVNFENSKVVSFTGAHVHATGHAAGAPGVYGDFINVENAGGTSYFRVALESFVSGRYVILAKNAAGEEILSVFITNNGGNFIDGTVHMFAGVIDLSDPSKREIWIDGVDRTNDTAWVTWNTYTDDTILLADTGVAPFDLRYQFGGNSAGPDDEEDSVGFVSFDESCSLVPEGVWDSNGVIRDPQAWEGWYLVQPSVFFGPSFWKNSGTTAPAFNGDNDMELLISDNYDGNISDNPNDAIRSQMLYNTGLEGNSTPGSPLPDAPDPDPRVEIMAPFWANTGNWINLSALTQTTFVSMFGVTIEDADFNSVFAVNKAALVNTGDAGNRLQIQDTIDAADAALFITDASGNVIDTMIYDSTPNGDSVLVPTGANYYVVITSDTGNAKIRKWDSDNASTVGSVTWESVFGFAFGDRVSTVAVAFIPADGLVINFQVPITSDSIVVGFNTIEYPQSIAVAGGIEFNIGTTVGDKTSPPIKLNFTLPDVITGGINDDSRDIILIPGNTYFWNLRFPSGVAHAIHLQYAYRPV